MISQAADVQNRLLRRAPSPDLEHLLPQLTRVALARGAGLAEPDEVVEHVFFLESGVASVVVTTADGVEVEAGLVGWEGVTPVAPLLDAPRSPDRVVMQLPGEGLRIAVKGLTAAMETSAPLRRLLARYVQVQQVQLRQTVLATAVQTVESRLARWILMCADRTEGPELPLTHEFLSIMLSVRRPSITNALHVLEGAGLVKATRGRVVVLRRPELEQMAGASYGRAEDAYRELIGGGQAP